MADSGRTRRTRPRRRRIAPAIVRLSLLLPAGVAGCASPTRLSWDGPSGPAAANAPVARAADRRPGADPGVRRVASQDDGADKAPEPESVPGADAPPGNPPPSIPAQAEFPIDLSTALRLAEVENPVIAEARQRIGEALALQLKSRVLLVPNLNAGTNYNQHTGNLERSSGTILNLNKKDLYFGGGAFAVTAGPVEIPMVNISSPLTNAIFEPLANRQLVEGARFHAAATANDVLLEVSQLHFELLAAEATLRVHRITAEQGDEVVRLTRAYAQAGQGRVADAERAAAELGLVVREVQQSEEAVAVASARLAHRLHLDQSVRIRPVAPVVEMVTLIDPSAALPELVRAAVGGRPEVKQRAALIAAAEARHQEERFRPILPTLWLGYSAGAYGGGSNLTGVQVGSFGGRSDFDVMAYWTFRNLGIGNLALIKQRRAEVGEAMGAQARAISRARSDVAAALADVNAARRRVEVTTRQLDSAEHGYEEDLRFYRNTANQRVIELVNSLQLVNRARVARIRAVTDYNKAEFRLFVALGSPPPPGEPAAPLPPAPIASPPLPPLAAGAGAADVQRR